MPSSLFYEMLNEPRYIVTLENFTTAKSKYELHQ